MPRYLKSEYSAWHSANYGALAGPGESSNGDACVERTAANQSRKEVNPMNYTKPEVIPVEPAITAIQGSKNISSNRDSSQYVTAAAYEADE